MLRRDRRLWPIAFESVGSFVWVNLALVAGVVTMIDLFTGRRLPVVEFALAWGVAVSVIATLPLGVRARCATAV